MKPKITIKLFATLARCLPESGAEVFIEPGETVATVIHRLGVPVQDAKLIFINGVKGELGDKLSGGERVGIFPPVGGG